MKPSKSILDATFTYTPAAATTVEATWRKFGWKPLSDLERAERRRLAAADHDADHGSEQDAGELARALGRHDRGAVNVVKLALLRTA